MHILRRKNNNGFSLIEVNMAVFVMAIGIVGLLSLFPAGLRESMQSRADLKQAMFAEYLLSVAAASAADPQNVSTFGDRGGWSATADRNVASTVQEVDSASTPQKRDYTLSEGDSARKTMRYRLRFFDAQSGITSASDPVSIKYHPDGDTVVVQVSEVNTGFFRSNPIFMTALMSWRQTGVNN